MHRLVRDPFFHFLVGGLFLFLIHGFLSPDPQAAQTIEISEDYVFAWRDSFFNRYGYKPSASDENQMLENFIKDEILYREALRLGLDRGDLVVRRRLIQKSKYLLDTTGMVKKPKESELQEYFELNAGRFRRPATVRFRHIFFKASHSQKARLIRAKLSSGQITFSEAIQASDPFAYGDSTQIATTTELRKQFGGELAGKIEDMVAGEWSAVSKSPLGLHIVYVEHKKKGRLPPLRDIQEQVARHYSKTERLRAIESAFSQWRARYIVSSDFHLEPKEQ